MRRNLWIIRSLIQNHEYRITSLRMVFILIGQNFPLQMIL